MDYNKSLQTVMLDCIWKHGRLIVISFQTKRSHFMQICLLINERFKYAGYFAHHIILCNWVGPEIKAQLNMFLKCRSSALKLFELLLRAAKRRSNAATLRWAQQNPCAATQYIHATEQMVRKNNNGKNNACKLETLH